MGAHAGPRGAAGAGAGAVAVPGVAAVPAVGAVAGGVDQGFHLHGLDDDQPLIGKDILTFLNRLTEGNKPYTKRIRFSQLSSFFNFVRNNIDPEVRNPCDRPMIRKLYRERVLL